MASNAWVEYGQGQRPDSGWAGGGKGLWGKPVNRPFKLGETNALSGKSIHDLTDPELWKMYNALNPGNPGAPQNQQRNMLWNNVLQEYSSRLGNSWRAAMQGTGLGGPGWDYMGFSADDAGWRPQGNEVAWFAGADNFWDKYNPPPEGFGYADYHKDLDQRGLIHYIHSDNPWKYD